MKSNHCITILMHYSHASVLGGFRTRQILYPLHPNEKKTFQNLACAQYSSHVLEFVWVKTSPRKRKCFIDCYSSVSALATVQEQINDVCQGTTVRPFPSYYAVSTCFHSFISTRWSFLQDACVVKALLWQLTKNMLVFLKFLSLNL